ncbi:MAG: ABC transporter permease, partial [Clostridia bacterium]|nr:ABC transporter permease [Clostridia bacterium]
MSNILSSILTTSFAASIIRIMVPILFAALAASITEKAGVVNIGLEGTMSLCALIAVTCAWKSGSTFVGVLGAIVLGILLSLMIGFFAFKFKTDIILCGIAVNTLGEGGAVLLLYLLTGSKGDTQTVMGAWSLPRVTIPVLSKIPVIGEIFFTNQSILTYVAFICVILVWILLYKTPLGIRIRAVGENDHAADSVGVGVYKIKYVSLIICGLLCGMAGAYMSLSY